jgi:SAM-dependent methyltransferase
MNQSNVYFLFKKVFLFLFWWPFRVSALDFPKKFHGTRGCVSAIPVHPAPLRHDDPQSVYSLVASDIQDVRGNFLATQVWPSARALSLALEQYFLQSEAKKVVCEFGSGPGLPSLVAARIGACQVYATDIDEFGLQLVQEAARQQDLSERITIQKLDLVNAYVDQIPWADLYIISDVFENNAVAEGTARLSANILARGSASVWTFAQSDRAPRETYLWELRRLVQDETLHWTPYDCQNPSNRILQYGSKLWLCDIDETNVFYG